MAIKKSARKRYKTRRTPEEKTSRRTRVRAILFGVIVLLIVAAVLSLLVLRSGSISLTENAIGTVLAPVQNFFGGITDSVKGFFTSWRNYDKLQDEYDALSTENQRLSLELSSADEAVQENDRLRSLLDAQDTYETMDPIYAKVIARDPGPWFTTFSLNRGSSDGVYSGMAVVNGDGLIGRVYEVGLNYSKVISIIDTRSSVACLMQRTRDNGVMRGQNANSDNVAQCYVYYLPNVNSITPGDTVITSGMDSTYPKGLKIGTVTAVSLDAGADGAYAIVTPSVDFQHIEEVFILRTIIETDTDVLPSVFTATAAPYQQSAATPQPGATATPAPDATGDVPYQRPTPLPTDGTANANGYKVTDLIEDEWASEN